MEQEGNNVLTLQQVPDINQILVFLSDWRTRWDLREAFNLSNTESYRLLRWLEKGRYIEVMVRVESKHQNRNWYYKTIK